MYRHTIPPVYFLNEMIKKVLSFSAAIVACTGIAAQELQNDSINIQKLDEVVVSDSRFKLKRENSGKTVIKISAEELKKSQGKTIAEIINSRSGIEINGSRGRDGATLGVYARGGRGRQTLVLIDGVRVSDPSSFSLEYDFRLLSTANVASIEIIKGAASTLYGTNAATAVINITTKKTSKKKISGYFQSSLGTNQTSEDQNYNISDFSNSAQISGTLSKFTYLLGFSNRFSDGLSEIVTQENEKDAFSNYSTSLKLGFEITDAFNVNVYGNLTQVDNDFDESFGFLDAPYTFESKQERVGLSSSYRYNKGSIHINTAYSFYDTAYKSAFPSIGIAENYVLDVYNKYTFNDTFYTILGLNYTQDQTEFDTTEKFTITDPYANVVYVSSFGLNINSGIRVNNHSAYGTNFVYNLNPSFTINTDQGYFKFLGSYATSYITPSLPQLYGFYGPNPDLEPEDDRTIEGGMEFSITNKLRISSLYFNRREKNFVFYDNTSFGYLNAENTIKAQGVEIELNWRLNENILLNGNYTYTERKGDNAIRIPKHKINASLALQISDRTNASLSYALTGKRSDTDFSGWPYIDVPLESFSLVDLYVGHNLIPNKLKMFLSLNNLFNETYTEVLGFTTRGRNVRVGFNLNL